MPYFFRVPSKDESDRDCATFVFQHCPANIKASAQGWSWKVKKRLSLNHVEAPALTLVEPRGQTFPPLDSDVIFDWITPLEWRFAQMMSVGKHFKIEAFEKLQFEPKCENKQFQQSFILIIPHWKTTFYKKHKISFAHVVFCNQR